MIAHGSDGQPLSYAELLVKNGAGQTLLTIQADATGQVSWQPTGSGKYFLCCTGKHFDHQGTGGPNSGGD